MTGNKFTNRLIRLIDKVGKYKAIVMTLAVVVVFVTTYLLILPAFTLERSEAEKQGGIDLPVTETIEKVDGKEKAVEYLKEIRETDKGLYDEYMICEGYEKFGEDI